MNVLQVITTLNANAGGPVEGLIQQGKEMNDRGHEVHTLTLDAPGSVTVDPRIEKAVYFLGPSYGTYRFNWRLEPWLRKHGRKFDVIIVHGMWQHHGYCVAKVARDMGLRYVVFLHGMLDPWFARAYPMKHLKKWLYWPWAEYRVVRDAHLMLFTTAEEMRLARRSFWLYKARERLVGYGIKQRDVSVEEGRTAFFDRFPQLAGKRNLLYLSRIHPKKGCDMLIDAFAQVAGRDPDLHLVLAGPGDEVWIAKLKAQVAVHGLGDRVTFTGMLKGAAKWGAYDASEVFVLPSHQENFGMVVAEALASGLPVLTTHNVNTWQEIHQDRAGLIEPDTPEGTLRLLEGWLGLAPDEKRGMEERAFRCFQTHFEVGRVTEHLIRALEDIVTGQRPAHTFRGTWPGASKVVAS